MPVVTPHTRRRSRDQSEGSSASCGLNTPRTAKRLKTYAQALCTTLELDRSALDGFVELPSTFHMLVDIKAQLIAAQKTTLHDKISRHLDSKEYLVRAAFVLITTTMALVLIAWLDEVRVAGSYLDLLALSQSYRILGRDMWPDHCTSTVSVLYSPDVSHTSGSRMQELIRSDPDVMRVPVEVLEFPDLFEKAIVPIPALLARCRGAMKIKILLSLGPVAASEGMKTSKKGKATRARILNIAELSTSLIPKHVCLEMKGTHWMRIAYLRAVLVDFNAEVAKGAIRITADAPTNLSQEGNAPAGSSESNNGIAVRDGSAASDNESCETPEGQDTLEQAAPDDETSDSDYGSREFWLYVDNQLMQMKAIISNEHNTNAEQAAAWLTFCTATLQNDLQTYKGRSNPGNRPVSTFPAFPWQVTIEDRMVCCSVPECNRCATICVGIPIIHMASVDFTFRTKADKLHYVEREAAPYIGQKYYKRAPYVLIALSVASQFADRGWASGRHTWTSAVETASDLMLDLRPLSAWRISAGGNYGDVYEFWRLVGGYLSAWIFSDIAPLWACTAGLSEETPLLMLTVKKSAVDMSDTGAQYGLYTHLHQSPEGRLACLCRSLFSMRLPMQARFEYSLSRIEPAV
ncbi:hypothetical protein NUW54_g8770 [Trametes sanguinea]|uniref:Uncharacterized protein n=1 Tax=Trametes sanguinea TaxID=158606 RepID=A0ACC1PC73_9APHY|nr:hypothetical protein NUW54_g8770 [Trametes sanguinea]